MFIFTRNLSSHRSQINPGHIFYLKGNHHEFEEKSRRNWNAGEGTHGNLLNGKLYYHSKVFYFEQSSPSS